MATQAQCIAMRHSVPSVPHFYVTAPQDCPYLENRQERKLFTTCSDTTSRELSDCLSKQGFRRSQNILYRPSCTNCSGCLSMRIDCNGNKLSKSQKRVLNKNRSLERSVRSAIATDEQFDLFKRYLKQRHDDGGMMGMDVYEFGDMIEETAVRSRVIEYRDQKTDSLVACSLTDVMDDGLSMVYSFFDPAYNAQSLGTYMILDHIDMTKGIELPYLYLGYWVPKSHKMSYKARFNGAQVFHKGKWELLGPERDYEYLLTIVVQKSIAQQISRIYLPNNQLILR